jgi:hypothetical protein
MSENECSNGMAPRIAKASQKHTDRSKSRWLKNGAAPQKAKATKQPKSKSEPKKRPKSFRGFADVRELVVGLCSLPAIDYSVFRLFDHPEWGPVECVLPPRLAAGMNSCVVSLPAAFAEIDQADTFLRLFGLHERPGVLRIVPGRPEWDQTVTV